MSQSSVQFYHAQIPSVLIKDCIPLHGISLSGSVEFYFLSIHALIAQYLLEGFASHLTELKGTPPRRAMYDVRSLTGEASFALPGKHKPEETSRRKPFGFTKRYQRSASTDTHSTRSTSPRPNRSTIASRQSPGPQTERNV